MININQRDLSRKLFWLVNSAAKYSHSGGREAIPIYCHLDQNNLPSDEITPASKIDAKLQMHRESIKMENGTLPGFERRRQVIAAVINDSSEAMTYTKAKSGKSYRMGDYPSVYFIQFHITPIIYFTNKSTNLIIKLKQGKVRKFFLFLKNEEQGNQQEVSEILVQSRPDCLA
jgi:hypothetical protein